MCLRGERGERSESPGAGGSTGVAEGTREERISERGGKRSEEDKLVESTAAFRGLYCYVRLLSGSRVTNWPYLMEL